MFSGGESLAHSEDCLTLNIWSPAQPGKYPVMVWIHGGAFMLGAGSYDMYHGQNLASKQEVVVVSLNYRLGALGFMSLPELAKESPNNAAGNYGFLDQIQALKWVQQNITAFNGDPGNVTIFGQSAGGMSVCTLMASPLAQGLFQKAIPMSGGCEVAIPREKGFAQGRATADKLGCKTGDVGACLRKKPADAFLPKSVVMQFISGFSGERSLGPVIDGYVLTESPIEAIRKGNYNKTPVMINTTRDEMRLFTMFIPGMSHIPKWAVNKLLPRFGGDSSDVFKYYSYNDYKKPVDLLNRVLSDAFIAQSFNAAEALSKTTDVYFYRFDWDKTVDPEKYGAFHGFDIPFVFGNRDPNSSVARKVKKQGEVPGQDELGDQMMRYYADFAKTGNPNGAGLVLWPKYSVEKKERLLLNAQVTVEPVSPRDVERYRFLSSRK